MRLIASSLSLSSPASAELSPSVVRTISVRAAEARASCCADQRDQRRFSEGEGSTGSYILNEVDQRELVVVGEGSEDDSDLLSEREAWLEIGRAHV